jgi:hypothetical protein
MLNLKTVRRGKDTEEQLGAELIKPVAKVIVGWRRGEEMSTPLDHFQTVANGHRKVEDVFHRADVANDIVRFMSQTRVAPSKLLASIVVNSLAPSISQNGSA